VLSQLDGLLVWGLMRAGYTLEEEDDPRPLIIEQRQAVETAFAELEHEHPFNEALALYEILAADRGSYSLRLRQKRLESVLRWLAEQLEVGLPELLHPSDEIEEPEVLSAIATNILAGRAACLRVLDELGVDLSRFEQFDTREEVA
jgi:hypothetical protein